MPAWDEAILGMKVGGKRKIICTPDKAYEYVNRLMCTFGDKGTPYIPPHAVLFSWIYHFRHSYMKLAWWQSVWIILKVWNKCIIGFAYCYFNKEQN